jgi:hypothetical protein
MTEVSFQEANKAYKAIKVYRDKSVDDLLDAIKNICTQDPAITKIMKTVCWGDK